VGKIKEIWSKQAREIESKMDQITIENGEILTLSNYIDSLLDYFEAWHLQDFEAVIVEYIDELEWNYENRKEAAKI
jgi:hypothetical protein